MQRIHCGASARFTYGHDLTLDQARTTGARILGLTPAIGWGLGIDTSGDLAGIIKARRRTATAAPVSYLLCEDIWGSGYATAAVRAFTPLLFAAGIDVIEAKHHPDNPASGGVLVKAGFVLVRFLGGTPSDIPRMRRPAWRPP